MVFLAFFNVAESQNLKLKIESSISQENTLIELIGYLDSFVSGDDVEPLINIVIEYCEVGDLHTYII